MRAARQQVTLTLEDGRNLPLKIRRSHRARRILLHIGIYDGLLEIVLPPGAPVQDGVRFARTQARWVSDQLSLIGNAIPFVDGACFPLLDRTVRIRGVEDRNALPVLEGDDLWVSGNKEALNGRVRRWLIARALTEIKPRAHTMATKIHRTPAQIRMRDTKSRWGSCSRNGNLNFSWRLVLAPEAVLDYVVAHEVAHLRELNHSEAFWAVVQDLCSESAQSRKWLRVNGATLHRYGRSITPLESL
ncbi:MAG: SprT family zinc-dependent metalloprotease [Pseudomonadota bacterium]|nr:SprT family zinc-dependent metalloprotease [Pseudomonadota bacterium]